MEWEVLFDEDFRAWFDAAEAGLRQQILDSIEVLEQFGPQLGRPRVDTVKGVRVLEHERAENPVFVANPGESCSRSTRTAGQSCSWPGIKGRMPAGTKRTSRSQTVDTGDTWKRWKERADMAINAGEIIATLPEADQRRIKERAARIIAREYSSPVESVEFEFALTLDGIPQITPEIMAAFDAAGCADASLSSRDGLIVMDFIRAAPTRQQAIASAIIDVETAGIGARVTRIDPEIVGADAAQDHFIGVLNSVLSLPPSVRFDPAFFEAVNLLTPSLGTTTRS
jgi:hypothetical protein